MKFLINSLNLEPYDLILSRDHRISSYFVRFWDSLSHITCSPYSHVQIYVGNGMTMDARWRAGVQVRRLSHSVLDSPSDVQILRPHLLCDAGYINPQLFFADLVTFRRDKYAGKYDAEGAVLAAFHAADSNSRYICSEFVVRILNKVAEPVVVVDRCALVRRIIGNLPQWNDQKSLEFVIPHGLYMWQYQPQNVTPAMLASPNSNLEEIPSSSVTIEISDRAATVVREAQGDDPYEYLYNEYYKLSARGEPSSPTELEELARQVGTTIDAYLARTRRRLAQLKRGNSAIREILRDASAEEKRALTVWYKSLRGILRRQVDSTNPNTVPRIRVFTPDDMSHEKYDSTTDPELRWLASYVREEKNLIRQELRIVEEGLRTLNASK